MIAAVAEKFAADFGAASFRVSTPSAAVAELRLTMGDALAGATTARIPADRAPGAALEPVEVGREDLRTEHASRRETGKSVPKDFKQWLAKAHGADFDLTTVREACRRLEHTPTDFTNLLRQSASALHAYESDRPI